MYIADSQSMKPLTALHPFSLAPVPITPYAVVAASSSNATLLGRIACLPLLRPLQRANRDKRFYIMPTEGEEKDLIRPTEGSCDDTMLVPT